MAPRRPRVSEPELDWTAGPRALAVAAPLEPEGPAAPQGEPAPPEPRAPSQRHASEERERITERVYVMLSPGVMADLDRLRSALSASGRTYSDSALLRLVTEIAIESFEQRIVLSMGARAKRPGARESRSEADEVMREVLREAFGLAWTRHRRGDQ